MQEPTISVVVAEDVMLTREGIVNVLRRAGVEVVGEAADLDGLMRKTHACRPRVVVTDIRMPPTHTDEGLQAARRIRTEIPGTGVLVLSQYVDHAYAMRLLEELPTGIGYLLKERVSEGALLRDAVRRVADGECVLDPSIVSRLVGRRKRQGRLGALSARELDVLALMAEGRSNSAIADALFITPRTVEAHSKQIFEKLGLDIAADTHRRVLAVLTFLGER